MENYEIGCFGFDDVIMGGLDLMRACRDGSSWVIDGDLKAVFVVEDVVCPQEAFFEECAQLAGMSLAEWKKSEPF